ncbi:MAG: hypothetical protein PUP92_25820 [Rhizonema sp. PD38]|nr:hypothetical protein [Rhizonema sp. PD38]
MFTAGEISIWLAVDIPTGNAHNSAIVNGKSRKTTELVPIRTRSPIWIFVDGLWHRYCYVD